MSGFVADPAFDAGSLAVGDLGLCQVRLQDDARFPWLILIPRVTGAVELEDLSSAQRVDVMEAVIQAGQLVRALGELAGRPAEKLNIAAIGNVTAQLHIHVVGRRRDDGLWPDPVWGRGPAIPYVPQARQDAVSLIRRALDPVSP